MTWAIDPTLTPSLLPDQVDIQPGSPADGKSLKELLACGQPLERVLPAFGANQARLLRLPHKGRLAKGADADLVVLHDRQRDGDLGG